jgi:3',5'-cyclic AMP phosphodiesterase CpdA
MPRLAWLTDVHLDFLDEEKQRAFADHLAGCGADAIAIAGDIANARSLEASLGLLASRITLPIYFVLGNHDYYHGAVAPVRAAAARLSKAHHNLHWLPCAGVVPLGAESALFGHGGWGDGRLGDFAGSTVMLNDYLIIADLAGLSREQRLAKLNRLGDEAATFVRDALEQALPRFRTLVFLTHVPPFREACWHDGEVSSDNWLPHFTCKAVGDVLLEAMSAHPECTLTVLCGHTHSSGTAPILPNLLVKTGGADYCAPEIQGLLTLA